jgi:7-cyano-7-deazaguanine synthase
VDLRDRPIEIAAADLDQRLAREPSAADYAVLCSAGLDSAVLVAHLARSARVQPLYISVGLAWEAAEQESLARLARTEAFNHRVLRPQTLQFDMRDVYPASHWAIRGEPPAFDTGDEGVYLAGRNVVLLTKAAVSAASQRIPRIAIGPLAGNPFPDATPQFFDAMSHALSLGLDHALTIEAPFAEMNKAAVIRLGLELGVDLGLTISCMNPQNGLHCGRCSKCRERRDAFIAAGMTDPTCYATPPLR